MKTHNLEKSKYNIKESIDTWFRVKDNMADTNELLNEIGLILKAKLNGDDDNIFHAISTRMDIWELERNAEGFNTKIRQIKHKIEK